MKILFVSQYFYPESFRGNDIVFDFVKRGHEVTVLTAKPNYPNGKFYNGYNFFNKRTEYINGAKIIRTPIIPRGNGNALRLLLNYTSFVFFSFFAVKFRIRTRFDVIFVQQLSPVTMVLPAVWIKKKQKIPLCLWVLDLWPESVTAASNIKNKRIIAWLNKLVKFIYKNTDKILISSDFFRNSISEKINIEKNEIIHFPNWAEDNFTTPLQSDIELPSFPTGFNIMFAGNIGEAQDFESILKAAERTQKEAPSINWILVGDGRKASWIRKGMSDRNLTNIYLLGRYPIETMPKFFQKADAMLVSLKDEPIFSLTVPAKIQAYMASGKIILGMFNGEGANIIKQANCGYAVPAGNYNELVKQAIMLSQLNDIERIRKEQNAYTYYKNNFDKNDLFDKLEALLKSMIIEDSDDSYPYPA